MLHWAKQNDLEAKAVALRGRSYVRKFFASPARETALALAVMHGYASGAPQLSIHCSSALETNDDDDAHLEQCSQSEGKAKNYSTSQILRRLSESLRQAREGRFPGLPADEMELAAAILAWRQRRQQRGWDITSYFARIRELWIYGSRDLQGVHMVAVRDHLGHRFPTIIEGDSLASA